MTEYPLNGKKVASSLECIGRGGATAVMRADPRDTARCTSPPKEQSNGRTRDRSVYQHPPGPRDSREDESATFGELPKPHVQCGCHRSRDW
jgi:hypothetical protein